MGRAVRCFGLSGRLEVDALIGYAQRKTGLADFGDDGWLRALKVLVDSINDEAGLTTTGQLIQRSRLAGALIQRLRIEEVLKRHPEVHDIDLGTIVMITGMQRTGTTLLQRLVNSHPGIRGVSGAEALDPVPAADPNDREAGARRRRATLAKKAISYLAPQFMAIHPIDYGEPEEDVLLLDLTFMSQSAEAMMHVPGYSRWLEEQDHSRSYEYLRLVLKLLCWQRPTGAWVLKTPQHMEYLDVFLRTFPDATIVQTHRDPRKALASFCSMVAHGRGIFSDFVDPNEIGGHWHRKTLRMVQRAMQAREDAEAHRFIDVSYYDLVTDPIAELRRVCRHAGIGFDHGAERGAERCLEANPQNRFGRHVYRMGDFGLSEQIVDEAFTPYRKKYAIPLE